MHNKVMHPLRLVLSLVAGAGAALVAYAVVFTHGNPHPAAGDPLLAFRLLPLELLVGLLVGVMVHRAFGRRAATPPRPDAAERMVVRLAMRRGGRFTLQDLVQASPLSESQARDAVARLLESGRLTREADRYRLRP